MRGMPLHTTIVHNTGATTDGAGARAEHFDENKWPKKRQHPAPTQEPQIRPHKKRKSRVPEIRPGQCAKAQTERDSQQIPIASRFAPGFEPDITYGNACNTYPMNNR